MIWIYASTNTQLGCLPHGKLYRYSNGHICMFSDIFILHENSYFRAFLKTKFFFLDKFVHQYIFYWALRKEQLLIYPCTGTYSSTSTSSTACSVLYKLLLLLIAFLEYWFKQHSSSSTPTVIQQRENTYSTGFRTTISIWCNAHHMQ